MAITVEESFANLIRILSDRQPHPQTYLLTGNLTSALQLSLAPPAAVSQEFPKMLYKPVRDGEDITRIVQNAAEQQAAEESGRRTTPSPQPPGFPQQWAEVDPSRGTDYRRVIVHNAQEEQTFKAVVASTKWVRDDEYELAGRPIGLESLVEERKEKLKRMVDELEIVEPPVASDANAESGSEES